MSKRRKCAKTVTHQDGDGTLNFHSYRGDRIEAKLKSDEDIESDIFDRSCPIGQFFTDPCLFLYLRFQKLSIICSRLRKTKSERINISSSYHRFLLFSITMIFFFASTSTLIGLSVHGEVDEKHEIQIFIPAFSDAQSNHDATSLRRFRSIEEFAPKSTTTADLLRQEKDWGALQLNFSREEGPRKIRNVEDTPVSIQRHYDFHHTFQCRDVQFKTEIYPNCNFFHEMDMKRRDSGAHTSYLSSGFYRDVWRVRTNTRLSTFTDTNPSSTPNEQKSRSLYNKNELAVKTLRMNQNVTSVTIADVARDAQIMEKLTSSPRIMDVYGYCSTSVSTEFIGQEIEKMVVPGKGYGERRRDKSESGADVQPQNELNAEEKLRMALEMAKGIADLHGFKDGVIVHDDIQLCQWLERPSKDGNGTTLVLGDFNRATIMRWNEKKGEYCKYFNDGAFGDYRSPEEYNGEKLDEKIDVYSFGNNLYALLTGMWPFYDVPDDEIVQSLIKIGRKSFVDNRYRNRSTAEARMVEVMEDCWTFDPAKRRDIFEVVERLASAVEDIAGNTAS